MLVQRTPVLNLPQDVRERLLNRIKSNLLMSDEPLMFFEGFYIAQNEIQSLKEAARVYSQKQSPRNLFE